MRKSDRDFNIEAWERRESQVHCAQS
jgi:hypothetical protein